MNMTPFSKGDTVWLKPPRKRGVRYKCDEDPKNPFNFRALEVTYVFHRGNGVYEYRACLKEAGSRSEILVAPEGVLTNCDGW